MPFGVKGRIRKQSSAEGVVQLEMGVPEHPVVTVYFTGRVKVLLSNIQPGC